MRASRSSGRSAPAPSSRLSANESPLGPSPKVVDAIRREAARAHLYPDGGSTELREALGRRLGVGADWLVVGNGADEVLGVAGARRLRGGRRCRDSAARLRALRDGGDPRRRQRGGEPSRRLRDGSGRHAPPRDAAHQGRDHLHAAQPRVDHRPAARDSIASSTAWAASRPSASWTRPTATSATIPTRSDGVELVRRYPTVVALRTFSKIAGLAGLRVGYAIARPESIDVLNRVRAPYNVNRLAQVAALAALEDAEHLERTRAVVLAERPRLRAALAERGRAVAALAGQLPPRQGRRSRARRSRQRSPRPGSS